MSLKRNFDGSCWELFQDESNHFKCKRSSIENSEEHEMTKEGFLKKKECIADEEKSGCPPKVIIFWKTTPFN